MAELKADGIIGGDQVERFLRHLHCTPAKPKRDNEPARCPPGCLGDARPFKELKADFLAGDEGAAREESGRAAVKETKPRRGSKEPPNAEARLPETEAVGFVKPLARTERRELAKAVTIALSGASRASIKAVVAELAGVAATARALSTKDELRLTPLRRAASSAAGRAGQCFEKADRARRGLQAALAKFPQKISDELVERMMEKAETAADAAAFPSMRRLFSPEFAELGVAIERALSGAQQLSRALRYEKKRPRKDDALHYLVNRVARIYFRLSGKVGVASDPSNNVLFGKGLDLAAAIVKVVFRDSKTRPSRIIRDASRMAKKTARELAALPEGKLRKMVAASLDYDLGS